MLSLRRLAGHPSDQREIYQHEIPRPPRVSMNSVAYALHVASGKTPKNERPLRLGIAIGDAPEPVPISGLDFLFYRLFCTPRR